MCVLMTGDDERTILEKMYLSVQNTHVKKSCKETEFFRKNSVSLSNSTLSFDMSHIEIKKAMLPLYASMAFSCPDSRFHRGRDCIITFNGGGAHVHGGDVHGLLALPPPP